MYCPECGIEERNANQFCRACGTDLRRVRSAVEAPDSITASAVSARDEIGRAVAARIRDTQNAYELKKVAEDVLPEIEKFLESPEDKRLRRMRVGTIISLVGIGATAGMTVAAIASGNMEMLTIAAMGVVAFFIGIAFLLNGIFLSVPKQKLADRTGDAERQRELDVAEIREYALMDPPQSYVSVTENTTRHLGDKIAADGRRDDQDPSISTP
ncbi:MAG: zinc ribbon domain-containing protein [Acidobacteriota bacterium]